jgi:hypothetical protein
VVVHLLGRAEGVDRLVDALNDPELQVADLVVVCDPASRGWPTGAGLSDEPTGHIDQLDVGLLRRGDQHLEGLILVDREPLDEDALRLADDVAGVEGVLVAGGAFGSVEQQRRLGGEEAGDDGRLLSEGVGPPGACGCRWAVARS